MSSFYHGESSTASSASPSKYTAVCAREGIVAANKYSNIISRSSATRRLSSPKIGPNDSLSMSNSAEKRRGSMDSATTSMNYLKIDQSYDDSDYLPRSQWISLGEGWFQVSSPGSGSSVRKGLHSLVDGKHGHAYMCMYEPRSEEGFNACTSANPEFDLEVSAKCVVGKTQQVTSKFIGYQIIFGFKSVSDYFSVYCMFPSQKWILAKIDGPNETIIDEVMDNSLKINIFSTLLLQIRGEYISVDINDQPVFTSVRIESEKVSLRGLVGVLSRGSQFAIKGWKIRGSHVSSNAHAPQHGNGGILQVSSPSVIFDTDGDCDDPQAYTMASSTIASPNTSSYHDSSSNTSIKKPVSLAEALQQKLQSPVRSIDNKITSYSPILSTMYATNVDTECKNVSNEVVFTRISKDKQQLGGGGPGQPQTKAMTPSTTSTAPSVTSRIEHTDNTQMNTDIYDSLLERHDKHVVETVMRDVIQRNLGVTFSDIAALHTAKRLLNEAIVLPLLIPEFFTGIREPWKGVLMFGPPGTGKTMLAKAVVGLSNTSTFFSCSSSSLISKYRGESEKIIKCLFEAARLYAPSVIFLDEVDALVSSRGVDGEHEASRRLKTEFFTQMDGIASACGTSSSVMVLATTNCPWDLDEAIRRRLEKRIYIPLPDKSARVDIFKLCLTNIPIEANIDLETLAEITEGYSGSDIHIVCREGSMMPMRRMLVTLSPQEIQQRRSSGKMIIPKVTLDDLMIAIDNTRPSVSKDILDKYTQFEREFGSK